MINFEFKSLNNRFKCPESRSLIALIVRCEPVVDFLLGFIGPRVVVELGDVVDDVLDGGDDHLGAGIGLVDDRIEGAKNVLLHVCLILVGEDGLLELLLGIQGPHVLLVDALDLLPVVARGPVLADEQL